MAHRAEQGPTVVREAVVELSDDMGRAARKQPPRQQQHRDQQNHDNCAEELVGAAPADLLDQDL